MKADRIKQIDAATRRYFVLEMRRMGGSYRQIAEAAITEFGADNLPRGWDERIACQDVKRELERVRKDVDESASDVRDVELARLDEMLSRVYPVALGTEIIPPDMRAVDRVLKIMERRAAMLGTDAPTKAELSGPGGGNIQISYVNDWRSSPGPEDSGDQS